MSRQFRKLNITKTKAARACVSCGATSWKSFSDTGSMSKASLRRWAGEVSENWAKETLQKCAQHMKEKPAKQMLATNAKQMLENEHQHCCMENELMEIWKMKWSTGGELSGGGRVGGGGLGEGRERKKREVLGRGGRSRKKKGDRRASELQHGTRAPNQWLGPGCGWWCKAASPHLPSLTPEHRLLWRKHLRKGPFWTQVRRPPHHAPLIITSRCDLSGFGLEITVLFHTSGD